ncbi:MAG: alpha/beta hydrolase [Cyclobacteriaceae bacterium]|nr:alpha/beta hydrolase [Cyclobacteriaceae bacterium]
MIRLCLLFLCFNSLSSLMAQPTIPLYSSGIPNSISNKTILEKQDMGTDGILRISDVTEPSLTIYQPEARISNGTAVIICPGGGYWILAAGHEGADVAKKFTEMGVTAFVLKYRLPDSRLQTNPTIAPLQDAQRALQLVRERASEFRIDPTKVGILGFSAGGHLASTASTQFQNPKIDNPTKISLRPDFQILIYPVISSDPAIAHGGSFEKLVGKESTSVQRNAYSSEKQVTKQTPPAFLVHASDDGAVSSLNSVRYYEAFLQNQVPAELHIYQRGGHGFGLKNPTTNDEWFDRLKNWMKANGWL